MGKRNRLTQSIITTGMLFFVIIITKSIHTVPWWSFIVPVILLGMVLKLRNWDIPYFLIGFVAGFLIWFGTDIYFDITLPGNVLGKLGKILSVSRIIIMALSGIIGGLLNGLALYTGQQLLVNTHIPVTEKDVW